MRKALSTRWAISFADLALILLAAFAMLYAMQPAGPSGATSLPASSRSVELMARDLFEPGEARFSAAGRARVLILGRTLSGSIELESAGHEGGSHRLDAYELAAARAMALARLLRDGSGEVSVSVRMSGGSEAGQRLHLRTPS